VKKKNESASKYPIVRISWHDAFALNSSWMVISDIDDEPCLVESVGFLLADAKKGHVVISQSWNSEEGIDSVLAIPVAMVVKTELLS